MEFAVSNDRDFLDGRWLGNHADGDFEIIKKSLTTSHLESAFEPEPAPEPPPPPPSSSDD